jgi:hypothetical protein
MRQAVRPMPGGTCSTSARPSNARSKHSSVVLWRCRCAVLRSALHEGPDQERINLPLFSCSRQPVCVYACVCGCVLPRRLLANCGGHELHDDGGGGGGGGLTLSTNDNT